MKRVLVIGGSGFSGRQLIKELLAEGHEVYAIEHRHPLPDHAQIRVIKGGIRSVNVELIDAVRPEIVFHFARPTLPFLRRAGRMLASRYTAIQNQRLIRELDRSRHSCKLVFASGSLMYGSSPSPHDEDSPMRPVSYARQYYRGEIPILEAIHTVKYPVMLFRFPWLLGNGSWFEWFYLKPMQQSHSVPLFGKGDNLMEVLDIQDAARMISRYAFDHEGPGIFNILSAGPVTQLEFASAVSTASGMPVRDYREVFRGRLEDEAIQAFTSNIVLATKYTDLVKDRQYIPLDETLQRILSEQG